MTPARLRADVETLASAEFAGRGTGQPGFKLAADFVAERMRALGLEPLGDQGTWFQNVPWTRVDADQETTQLTATGRAGEVTLKAGTDFAGRVWFDQHAEGDLALLRCPDPGAVAMDETAAAGRIVLVDVSDVDLDVRFAGQAGAAAWSTFTSRLRTPGAAAVVLVHDGRAQRMGGMEGTDAPGGPNPAARAASRSPNELYVSRSARDRLAALAGEAESSDSWRPLAVHVRLDVTVRHAGAPACNVIGRLPGSDPAAAAEHVLIGCHLDHLGVQNGTVHPGADDDGSGTAALLGLAEVFARTEPRPRRSLVFVAFCGEERGLLGSKHFVSHPPVPLASVVAELQLDMIGRCEENARETAAQNLNSLHLIGTEKLSADLHALCVEVNRRAGGFDLEWDEEEVFWRSDHVNFAKCGVPIAFFFTGFHSDYHLPGDTADKLDYPKLSRVATYVHAVATELAQQDGRPLVDQQRWEKSRERLLGPSRPAAPVRR